MSQWSSGLDMCSGSWGGQPLEAATVNGPRSCSRLKSKTDFLSGTVLEQGSSTQLMWGLCEHKHAGENFLPKQGS